MNSSPPQTIDEYIANFPQDVQQILHQIRATIHQVAPHIQEKISYQIPTFTLHGNLIYFAAFKNHISIYPAPRGAEVFKNRLAAYKGGKGTIQLPLNQPIPFDLIREIVQFRIEENLARTETKKKATP